MTKVPITPIFLLLFVSETATAHVEIAYFLIAFVGGMIFALVISILTLYITNRGEIGIVMGLNILTFFMVLHIDPEFINKDNFVTIYPSASSFVILTIALCLRNKDIDANRRRDKKIENERNER